MIADPLSDALAPYAGQLLLVLSSLPYATRQRETRPLMAKMFPPHGHFAEWNPPVTTQSTTSAEAEPR